MSPKHRWIRIGWAVICLLVGICPYLQGQERLFVGQGQDGLRVLSTENGAVLDTIEAVVGIEAIAIDEEQGGLIWVFAEGILQRLSPQGDPELAILPPATIDGGSSGTCGLSGKKASSVGCSIWIATLACLVNILYRKHLLLKCW